MRVASYVSVYCQRRNIEQYTYNMNDQIKERIDVIDSYKSYIDWVNYSDQKQYRMLQFLSFLGLISLFFLLFLIYISIRAIFNIGFEHLKWEKSGLLVFLIIGMSLKTPMIFTEFLLKRHRRIIYNLNATFSEKVNFDLEKILKYKKKPIRLLILMGPAIIIMIVAFFQQFYLTPIWNLFAYVIPVFGIYFLSFEYLEIRKLRRNFSQVTYDTKEN
jgi:hypothetical protein